jgi:hypothetical protein
VAWHDPFEPDLGGTELYQHAALSILCDRDVLRGVRGGDASTSHVDQIATIGEVVDLKVTAAGIEDQYPGRSPL